MKGRDAMQKIVVIDGQGGRMGKTVIEQLLSRFPDLELYGIGTNSIATAALLKAGAAWAATGENPVTKFFRRRRRFDKYFPPACI